MQNKSMWAVIAVLAILTGSCSKRNVPSRTAHVTLSSSNPATAERKVKSPAAEPKPDTAAAAPAPAEKPAPKPEPKPDFPKVITVNDNAASKSIDGRLFYDVLGHRYWKNYKDGKYYLFDKSMYNNPDFTPHK